MPSRMDTLINRGNNKMKDLKNRAKSLPYVARTEVSNIIDPKVVFHEGELMRLPTMEGHNLWYFYLESDRDFFLLTYPLAEIWS